MPICGGCAKRDAMLQHQADLIGQLRREIERLRQGIERLEKIAQGKGKTHEQDAHTVV